MTQQTPLRCVIMRGGTSKGVFFHEADLPAERGLRDRVLLAAFGSPDPRQVDGLGGATSTTSKAAILARGTQPGVDVNYTFAQVAVTAPIVDYRGNCGNISSAVGPFAIDEGLVEAREPVTTVRILNTNTGKIIEAEVPVAGGRAAVEGDCRIAGVPGSGARVRLAFVDPAGSVTGRLLPTGRARDVLEVDGLGAVEASLVDAANPLAFVRAADLGLSGAETGDEIDHAPGLLDRLERIRCAAAVLMGITATAEEAARSSLAVPKIALVAPPRDYQIAGGAPVGRGDADVLARILSMQRAHRAYALTGAIATAAAAAVAGTLVAEAAGPAAGAGRLRIGHPAGVMALEVVSAPLNGGVQIVKVIAERTARRLMEGAVLVPTSVLAAAGAAHG